MAEKEEAPKPRPIIIVKRKKAGHGGHHGGAWKVAYADFVTAMMALFIVLWLMSADDEVKKEIASYFNNPTGPGTSTGTAAAGAGNSIEVPKDDMKDLAQKVEKALKTIPNFSNLKDQVEITVTADGLRIELLETEAGMFFESGVARPSATGSALLQRLAEELGKLPNQILIEGHTDSKPFAGDGLYGNWELSSDRANSARRLMQQHGIKPDQVAQVRGYGNRQLRHPEDPQGASNRRITVIVQYQAKKAEDAPAKAPAPAAGHAPAAEPAPKAAHAPAAGHAPAAATPHPPAKEPAPAAEAKKTGH